MAQHSYSFLCIHYLLLWLCITLIIIQVSSALNDGTDSSSIDDNHEIERRNSKKVAQMLQQILQRGEIQLHPYRFREFLHRLHRRQADA